MRSCKHGIIDFLIYYSVGWEGGRVWTWESYTEHAGTGSRDEEACVVCETVSGTSTRHSLLGLTCVVKVFARRREVHTSTHSHPISSPKHALAPLTPGHPAHAAVTHPSDNLVLLHALWPEQVYTGWWRLGKRCVLRQWAVWGRTRESRFGGTLAPTC